MGEKFDLADAIAEEAELLENADEADADEIVETTAEVKSDEQDIEETVETEEVEEVEAKAEDSEEESDESGDEPESLEPLEHWSEEVKAAFNRVDPEAQQAWIDQHKTFQRGYNELVEKSKGFEDQVSSSVEVNNILKEFEPLWSTGYECCPRCRTVDTMGLCVIAQPRRGTATVGTDIRYRFRGFGQRRAICCT